MPRGHVDHTARPEWIKEFTEGYRARLTADIGSFAHQIVDENVLQLLKQLQVEK